MYGFDGDGQLGDRNYPAAALTHLLDYFFGSQVDGGKHCLTWDQTGFVLVLFVEVLGPPGAQQAQSYIHAIHFHSETGRALRYMLTSTH